MLCYLYEKAWLIQIYPKEGQHARHQFTVHAIVVPVNAQFASQMLPPSESVKMVRNSLSTSQTIRKNCTMNRKIRCYYVRSAQNVQNQKSFKTTSEDP